MNKVKGLVTVVAVLSFMIFGVSTLSANDNAKEAVNAVKSEVKKSVDAVKDAVKSSEEKNATKEGEAKKADDATKESPKK
jgi:hypothetical protein